MAAQEQGHAARSASTKFPLSTKEGAVTKSGLVDALAKGTGLSFRMCDKLLKKLALVATKEVKSAGKFTIPGVCVLKIYNKPATLSGKQKRFGRVVTVKKKPAAKLARAY